MMLVAAAGLSILGMILIFIGWIWVYRGIVDVRELKSHVGTRPVTRLAEARQGDRVHVLGTVLSPDVMVSPRGPTSAYLAVDLNLRAVGRPSLLKERHGTELTMRDGAATAVVRMEHAEVLDREMVQEQWYPGDRPPARARPALEKHGIRIARPRPGKTGVELRYRERAIRSGDPLRVHGLVLATEVAEDGSPRVLLGTDRRVPLHVSNASDADLVTLGQKARKWLKIGIGVCLCGGLSLSVGIALSAYLSQQ